MKKELPRILIAGTNSGCGKTTFVSGLLTALKRREKDLRAFKCGPDYIDPMFHASALGVPCRNLDLQFFDENTLRFSLAKNGGSLSVIEGVMGYYDGVGMTTRASSYAVAMASDTPAVLVVDARGAAHSVLAVIGGFLNLHPKSHIRGVILNRCSAMLYPRMKQAIADQFGGAVLPLGYLPVMKDCTLESRHLGLITAQEMTDLQEKLEALADQIEKSVDIPALCALAASAPELSWEPVALPEEGPPLRIAVARDNAFCFYYEDNLDLLRSLGAELVPFSPIADAALPENIRGLYLGGGYPELYAESLSKNQSMKDSIRQALEAGLPCIAECGGFLYLQKELEGLDFDVIAGTESRGFIFGMPLAYNLHKPFVPIRKKGKLPREVVRQSYDLEYGSATIEMHKDALKPGQKVVLVDDLIATGGPIEAAAKLVEQLGGEVVKMLFVMELAGLKGRERLSRSDISSAIVYEGK